MVSDTRGNRPFMRIPVHRSTNNKRRPINGLPRNFYNPDWWKVLLPHQQSALEVEPDVVIPKLPMLSRL